MDEEAVGEALSAARAGDEVPVWELLDGYRDRLAQMIRVRLHPAVRPRVDASDVIQESLVDVLRRLPDYIDGESMPFYLWVRFLTNQKLQQIHRQHLGADKRDARREVRFDRSGARSLSAADIAQILVASEDSPSVVVGRAEAADRIHQALEELEDIDREILVLRHFERLTNSEVARLLEIGEPAAGMRYLRALKRLGSLVGEG